MTVFLVSAVIFLLAYEIYFFLPLWNFRFVEDNPPAEEPVSVIIAAHNEADNLKKNLPLFFRQDYPHFQVVVIDDRSTDHTLAVLDEMKQQYGERLHVVRVQPQEWETFKANKKFALTLGIKAARYDKLLLTDADCLPASDHWISRMTAPLRGDTDFVLGYGRYRRLKGFLNTLIRYETLQTGIQYAGFALRGMPYMGVGRNLAYRRSFFLEKNGFGKFFDQLSGDDDLLVNQWAHKDNVQLCLHPDAHTISTPKHSWAQWIRQKRRHVTTARFYRPVHKWLLGAYALARLLFWLSLIPGLYFFRFDPWFTTAVLLRMGWSVAVWHHTARRWNESFRIWQYLPAEFVLIIMYMYISLLNSIKKPSRWN